MQTIRKQNQKPPDIPVVEPMNLGEIIDFTLELYKKNFKNYIIASLIIFSPSFLLIGLFFALSFIMTGRSSDVTISILIIPFGLANYVISIFFLEAMIKITSEAYHGRKITYLESIRFAFQKLLPVGGTMILMLLVLSLFILLVVLSFIGGSALGSPIVGFFLALIPVGLFLYYFMAYSLTPYVVIIEGKLGLQALKRSRELFRSSKNAMLKVIAVPYLMYILGIVGSFIPFLSSVLMLLYYPLPIIAMTLVYFDIRIRYEGYDLLLHAERLDMKLKEEREIED